MHGTRDRGAARSCYYPCMVEEVLTALAYLFGAITLIGGLICLGIILVGIVAGVYQLGAWVIDGLRD